MGNSELKEYIVTLHKHEDLDSFYEDMETPGGNLYIPDRAVEVVNRRPISRNTHYWLTAEEAIQLKNDPRVWDVSLTPEELGLVSVPGWTDTNGYYSKDIVTTANDKNWGLLRGFDRDHISGWGSDGATKVRTSTLNSKLNGTNVDFVIRGYTVDSAAPEFAVNADGTGGTRYFYVNWGDYGLGSTYTQAALTNDRSGAHETICGSIAFGNTQGWSRKARFTSIPNNSTYYDYVRAWHQAKSVNPDTGFKNPTVVTDSYGSNYGIDATAITSITYRGTTYNGPFTTSTDFSQYKLWLNNSGETLYNQPDGRVVFSYTSAATRADIEDLVAAGVIFVGISHNWRAYHAVENDQDWNNAITFGGGTFYYNQGLIASATGAIQTGAIMDLAANTPSPRSGRGPRVNIWAPSRTTGISFYAGETPDGTGLGYEGGVQTDPASQGYLPMIKNSRDPRNSNYYLVKTTDGTSFSAPQVAGVIGLWAELKPDLTPAQALTLLQTHGDSTGVVSTSNNYGDPTSLAGATALALGFSSPTFSITANKSSLKPTDVITYTISTTNVPTGSTLYLVESGTSVAGDFVDGLTQIAVTTTGDSTTLSRTVSGTFTGSKTSILQVKTGGYNGTVQATASSVALITTTTTTTAATFIPSGFDQSTVVRYANRYTLQIRDGVIDSSAGQIWQLVRGSLPPNSTLFSTGLITVNVSNILPFSREQFIQAGAPDLPSLGQAAWEQWLAQYVKLRQTFDYEFQVEISDGTGPAQIGHTVRIIHLKPPINVNFDMANFDRDAFDQTAGATSWFTINQAYLSVDPAQDYYLVMTTSPNSFSWVTDSNLGEVINGSVSRIGFESIAADAARTYFQVKTFTASRLPQGVELLPDGYLSGRFSFRCYQDDSANLPANDIYTFTVRTGTKNFYAYADRVFTLRVRRLNLQPYDSIWLNAFPPAEQRVTLYNLLTDPNTIPDDFIFRPSDPWWGRSTFFRILMLPSVNLRTQNQYEAAMQTNHYQKTLLFDQLRMSVMLDANLNSIYEVIYLTVRDDQLGRDYASGNYQRQPNQIDLRAYIKNYHIDGGQTFYTFYPNALENMRNILSTYIGMYNPGVAPEWMLSFQPVEDQPGVFTAPVGFMPVIVLAYCRPGRGRYVYHRLSTVNFNQFEFESDRFNQEARLSMNYNTVTNQFTPGEPVSFDNNSTEFDYNTTRVVDRMEYSAVPTDLDKYLIFPRFGVFR